MSLVLFPSSLIPKIRDDSSSDSEELSAQTPLLDTSIGLLAPKPAVVTLPAQPKPSDIGGFDSMFTSGDNDEVPLGGTAQTTVNEP